MQNTKILCVHQGHELYGSDRVFIQSVAALREEWPDSRITVHLPKNGPIMDQLQNIADEITIGYMTVIRRNHFSTKSISSFFSNVYHNYLLTKGKDLIYINTGVILSYNVLSFFTRKKYILHIHEIPTGLIKIYFYLLSRLTKAKIVANSHATAKSFLARKKSRIVYNGIENKIINSNKSDGMNLLLIGRINKWKGHSVAIEAISLLKQKGITNIQLKFAGNTYDGQERHLRDLTTKIDQSGLSTQISFHDFIADTSNFYEWANIILVPSIKPEPFGLVAIEAMRAGLPVIAANHGGLPEIVIHDETGLLVKSNDKTALAEAIEHYCNDINKAKKHGEAGKERFLKHFLEEHYKNNFIAAVTDYVA
jgi:glycosyltransferase involved in cell wall biosynthesis